MSTSAAHSVSIPFSIHCVHRNAGVVEVCVRTELVNAEDQDGLVNLES